MMILCTVTGYKILAVNMLCRVVDEVSYETVMPIADTRRRHYKHLG